MKTVPPVVERLLEALGRLPGIGPRSAGRIAYHLLRAPAAEVEDLARALLDLKQRLVRCAQCGNVAERNPCPVCADPGREAGVICVVEQPKDVAAFEETGLHHGVYYVLMGRVAPLEGERAEELDLAPLVARVRAGGVREVIMATNPTLEGEATALHLARLLKPYPVRVTRLARGLPTGGAIEYANRSILADALAGRQPVSEEEPPAARPAAPPG